jgi:hypothetical protein
MFAGIFGDHDDEDGLVLEGIDRWMCSHREPPRKLYRIHRGKLVHTRLLEELLERRLLRPDPWDDQWLTGPEPVCIRVMTALAQRILRSGEAAAIVTNRSAALQMASREPLDHSTYYSRRLDAVSRLLPVSPSISPEALARFKADHASALRRFRSFVERLIRRDANESMFEARLAEAEELRDNLIGELETIGARGGASPFALIIANIVAPLLEASFFSAAANGIGLMDLTRTRARDQRRRHEIGGEGLAYAALARTTLRARTSDELLA